MQEIEIVRLAWVQLGALGLLLFFVVYVAYKLDKRNLQLMSENKLLYEKFIEQNAKLVIAMQDISISVDGQQKLVNLLLEERQKK